MKYFINIDSVIRKTEELKKGDRPGHPFRGNQYAGGKRKGAGKKASGESSPKSTGSKPKGESKVTGSPKKKETDAEANERYESVERAGDAAAKQMTGKQRRAFYDTAEAYEKNAYKDEAKGRVFSPSEQADIRTKAIEAGMKAAKDAGFKEGQTKAKDSTQRLKERMSSMTDDELRAEARKIRGNDVVNVFSAKQRNLEAISAELDRRSKK